jgi:hypothetical protein
MKQQEDGENYTVRSYIICTHQMMSGLSSEGGHDGQNMQHE